MLLIKNARILENNRLVKKNVFCEKGKITQILEPSSKEKMQASKVFDAKQKILLPAGIDVHVHFREPGMEKKATWKTESKAALAGGIGTVLDMPNTLPPTFTVELLEQKKLIAEKNSLVNFGFHFGAENLNEIKKAKTNSIKIFMGKSTGNIFSEEKKIEEVFLAAKEMNLVCVLHAEDEKIIEENLRKAKERKQNNVRFHNLIRSEKAELTAIKNALKLQEKTGNKIHFAHVSSAKGMKEILKAKKKSGNISCEVSPHHLFLNELDLKKLGNFGKMNPPLRTKKDNEFLLNALKKGLIDVVATDHAPHTKKEKLKDYFNAPSGVTGVQTVLALLLNEFGEKGIPLIQKVLCENPAKIFGIKNKGKIIEGFDADFTLIDFTENTIKDKNMFYKCKWTPFNGKIVKGKVHATILRGNVVFIKGKTINSFKGKEIELEKKK